MYAWDKSFTWMAAALCFPSWVSPCRQPRSTSPSRAAAELSAAVQLAGSAAQRGVGRARGAAAAGGRTDHPGRRIHAFKHRLEMTEHGRELTSPLPKGAGTWVGRGTQGDTHGTEHGWDDTEHQRKTYSRGRGWQSMAGELNTREKRQ